MRSFMALILSIAAACGSSEPEARALYMGSGYEGPQLENSVAGRLLFYTSEKPWQPHGPISESQRATLLHTQGGGTTALFAVTIRYYVIGYPPTPCYVQFGPGYHEEPIDLVRLLEFVDDRSLRDKILDYLVSIDQRSWHRFETVIDGVAVKSERVVAVKSKQIVGTESGAIWTMSIDACRRHEKREDVAIYGRQVL